MLYSLNLEFHFVEALLLDQFFMFKAREYVGNQTAHMWFFWSLHVLQMYCGIKYLEYQVSGR